MYIIQNYCMNYKLHFPSCYKMNLTLPYVLAKNILGTQDFNKLSSKN